MCWITKQKWRTRPRIAKKRIEVWKVYYASKYLNGLRSPYMGMSITEEQKNVELHTHLGKSHQCFISANRRPIIKPDWNIEEGFHSFKKGSISLCEDLDGFKSIRSNRYEFAIEKCSFNPVIVRCYIPIGATYYLNELDEYVSDKIIVGDIIPYDKLPKKL